MQLPFGHFFDSYIESYRSLYSKVPQGGVTCEVGAYYGRSLCSVADLIQTKHLTVHVVDTWGDLIDGSGGPILEIFNCFLTAVKDFGILDNLILHVCSSDAATDHIADESLDLVFIDANHRQEIVLKDITNYAPLVHSGGYLAGHDYNQADRGVTEAVNLCFGSKITLLPNSIWMVQL
jgi:hypothetical protein